MRPGMTTEVAAAQRDKRSDYWRMDRVSAGRVLGHEGTWHCGTAYAGSGAPARGAARPRPGAGDPRVSVPGARRIRAHDAGARLRRQLARRTDRRDGRRRWTVADPALLTWEVGRLAQWLRALAGRTADAPTVFAATEPNLELEARRAGDSFLLRATSDQEFSPWEGDPWIDFAPAPGALRQFADDLEAALARFPER